VNPASGPSATPAMRSGGPGTNGLVTGGGRGGGTLSEDLGEGQRDIGKRR